jgi:hypothetical protein
MKCSSIIIFAETCIENSSYLNWNEKVFIYKTITMRDDDKITVGELVEITGNILETTALVRKTLDDSYYELHVTDGDGTYTITLPGKFIQRFSKV